MLAVSCSDFRIRLLSQDGALTDVKAEALSKEGIPAIGNKVPCRIKTDFSEWKLSDSSTAALYAKGLGYETDFSSHQVYEFCSAKIRYLVPTLVLLRAMLRPASVTLKAAFSPHGLDQITVPLFGEEFLERCILNNSRSWFRNDSIEEPLYWMYCRPSARRMFDSIYRHCRSGTIGIDLPIGKVQLSVKHVRQGGDYLVTYMAISRIETDEPGMYEYMGPQKSTVQFHRNAIGWSQTRAEAKQNVSPIPLAPCGRVTLNDEEWSAVEQCFTFGKNPAKHSPRLLIDGILLKLSASKPWRECGYPVGTWINASNLYQKLCARGQWPEIIETLKQKRALAP